MSEQEKTFLKLVHDNEQDQANAKLWWIQTPMNEKMLLWDEIQAMPDEGYAGVISRLAQLKFAELAEELQ